MSERRGIVSDGALGTAPEWGDTLLKTVDGNVKLE